MLEQVDVDELANKKVLEIEKLLDSDKKHELDLISSWFIILKQIITAADLHRSNENRSHNQDKKNEQPEETGESIYADYNDDNERINTTDLTEQFATNSVKWTIRVKAFKQIHRLVQSLRSKHLPDLIRLSFVAATSPYDDLKLQGFETFKYIINRFANIEEKEFPGHSILEQYRTQIISAIKPAFDLDAPPYITAIASQVCCLWICRGLEKEPAGLKRTYRLMMSTIDKLENQNINQNSKLYTECELEQERLDILGSWAQLYIRVKELNGSHIKGSSGCLNGEQSRIFNQLVGIHINSLINKWWEALRDYALLIIPRSRNCISTAKTSHGNEQVYTREVALRLFRPLWPKLILATSIWLCNDANSPDQVADDSFPATLRSENRTEYFKFICGIIMKELCDSAHSREYPSQQNDTITETTIAAIKSLNLLMKRDDLISVLEDDLMMASEYYNALHCILINRVGIKSKYRILLRQPMDTIFLMIVRRLGFNQSIMIKDILSHLCCAIHDGLIDLKEAISENKATYVDRIRTNLVIRIYNVVTILQMAVEPVFEDAKLKDSIESSFKSIISFDVDPPLKIEFLDLLKDLPCASDENYKSTFVEALYQSKIEALERQYNMLKLPPTSAHQYSAASIDCLTKSLKSDIANADEETRVTVMCLLLKAVIDILVQGSQQTSEPPDSTYLKDISLSSSNLLEELARVYPQEFDKVMSLDDQMKKNYESVLKMKQNPMSSTEIMKHGRGPQNKLMSNHPSKPHTKIILKTNFGNFYSDRSGK